MKAIDMIKDRRSIRKYKDELVSKETMNEIMELSKWAPSWGNFQIARYTLVENTEKIKQIADTGVHGFSYNISTLKNAKSVMVLSYVQGKSGKLGADEYATSKKDTWEVFDAGIACQTFCLAAHSKGVGTVIFGIIDDENIRSIIDLPKEETVAAVVVYGYPDEEVAPTKRMDVKDIYRYIK